MVRRALIILISLVFTASATLWTGNGDGSSWLDDDNWDTGIPGSGDIATIGVDGTTVNIGGAAQSQYTVITDAAGETVNINLNSGSHIESAGNTQTRVADDSFATITINDGTWSAPETGSFYGPQGTGSATFNVLGGTLGGYYRFRYNTMVNVSGGTLDMGNNGGQINFVHGAALTLSGTGKMIFDVFDDNDNESLLAGAGTDISGGTVYMRFDSAYTPMVGHSFDLLGTGFTVDPTGSNISSTDIDGKYQITWDTSQWGVGSDSKGVLVIDAVTVIPEPASLVMMLCGAAAMLYYRGFARERP